MAQGAQVLVNISNDGWYGDSGAWAQHLNQARMRAIENNRWLLRDTNTGLTASIGAVSVPRYARNALRLQVMPALAQAFPGFQQRFARSAAHAQSAQRMLTELAAQDLVACLDGDTIDVGKLRAMSIDRVQNLLRHWFATRSLRMPSTAWLGEMVTQLVEARQDAPERSRAPALSAWVR